MCLNFVTVKPYEIFLTTKVFQTTVYQYIFTIALGIIHKKHVVLCDELSIPVAVGLFTGLHGGWLYTHGT